MRGRPSDPRAPACTHARAPGSDESGGGEPEPTPADLSGGSCLHDYWFTASICAWVTPFAPPLDSMCERCDGGAWQAPQVAR